VSRIGVDAGTSLVKAVRFGDGGEPERTASATVPVARPRPGWAEQDLADVWDAVTSVVREVAADGVELVAITGQGDGCWLVDAAGDPVRPAMLWNDARAASVVDGWERDGLLSEAFRVTGSYGNAGLASAQLAWLRDAEPDSARRAATLLSCDSWLHLRMTGRRTLDVSEACNPFLDARTGAYADGLLDDLGLGWARPLLPEVAEGPGRVAPLLDDVSGALGLRRGTPVVLAPYDVPATALGVGAVEPGRGFAVLGTTLCVGLSAADPGLDRAESGMSLRTGWPERWLLAYATLAGTEVLEWAKDVLAAGSAAELVALAATSTSDTPPLVLPYLSPAGERAPFRDARAKGTVLGLSLEHDRADVARGVLEGLSLAVRDCLVAAGGTPESLAVCGGGARSDAWCQLLADVTRLPVVRADQDQVGARGAVLTGAVVTGAVASVDEAAASVGAGTAFEPGKAADRLDAAYARFVAAREAGAARA
jgi:erythritol kinase (D-erythritol 1-phosphate-forming)